MHGDVHPPAEDRRRDGADDPSRNSADANGIHPREIDHQAALTNALAGNAVTAASNRYEQLTLACESQCTGNVCGTVTARDQRR